MLEIATIVDGVHRRVDVHSLVIGTTYCHKLTREDLYKELVKLKCPGIESHMGHMDLALRYGWWQQQSLADSCTAAILSLFDHPVGMAKQRKRYGRAECIRGIQEEISIDKDFKFAAVQRL